MDITSSTFVTDIIGQKGIDVITAVALQVIAGIVTIIIGFWLSGRASRFTIESLSRIQRIDNTIVPMIGALVRYGGMTLTMVVALGKFGVETTSIIAVLGAAGLAIGLALQGTLSNVAAGLMLVFLRPFKVGDWIEAQGVAGTVDSILIFHTVLRSGDNKRIIVPNGALSNGTVTNYSAEPLRKVIFDVGIDYDADLKNAQNILLAMADDPRVLKDPAPVAVVSNLGESAITLSLRVWVKNADYWDVMFMFNEKARDALGKEGIGIPFPQRVVKVVQGAMAD